MEDEENEINDDFPYDTKEEYHMDCDFISDYWINIHARKWGMDILNDKRYKKAVVEKSSAYDIDNIDDIEVKPWISTSARELLIQYFTLRVERTVKKAFLISACEGRRTLNKLDVIKSILNTDIDERIKECLCGEIHLSEGEKVSYD